MPSIPSANLALLARFARTWISTRPAPCNSGLQDLFFLLFLLLFSVYVGFPLQFLKTVKWGLWGFVPTLLSKLPVSVCMDVARRSQMVATPDVYLLAMSLDPRRGSTVLRSRCGNSRCCEDLQQKGKVLVVGPVVQAGIMGKIGVRCL